MSRADTERARRSRAPRSEEDRKDAKRAAARALSIAKARAGRNYDELADMLGVNAKRVARLCSDDDSKSTGHLDVVPTVADAILLDEPVFNELLAEIVAARVALHGPPTVLTVEQYAYRALAADHKVGQLTNSALADDGKITGPEAPAILEAKAEQRIAHDDYEAALKRRCAR